MKVHHVGYAVKNIEDSMQHFQVLGYKQVSEIVADSIRNVKIVFLQNDTEKIELVAPNGENTPVDSVLKKSGPTPYHICYEVGDIEEAITILDKKWLVIRKPEIAPAINNRKVAFLLNNKIGLIELVESK